MSLSRFVKVCLIALLAQHAAAEVKVNFDHANPPFMYAESGKVAGIYPAIIKAAFSKMGEGVAVSAVPWAKAIEEIDKGEAGVGGIYKNAERLKKYDYSQQIFVEKLKVYFNKSKAVSFSSVADLKGLRVGVIRGWSYGDEFDAAVKSGEIKSSEVTSDEQNFSKLNAGRLDAVIAIEASGTMLMRKFPAIAATETPVAENATYLAFGKQAGLTATLTQFDKAIAELQSSGEFDKIVEQALSE